MGDRGKEIEFQAGMRDHSLFLVVHTGFGAHPALTQFLLEIL